jgi:transcriptional regulator with XRE-family HTH domain
VNNIEEFYKVVGERIKDERKKQGYTQNDLADAVELSRTSVTNIESGRQKYPLHKLWEIAKFLRVDMAQLLPQNTQMPELKMKKSHDIDDDFLYGIIKDMEETESRDDK